MKDKGDCDTQGVFLVFLEKVFCKGTEGRDNSGEIFATHIYGKGLVSRMYKELLKFSNRVTNN